MDNKSAIVSRWLLFVALFCSGLVTRQKRIFARLVLDAAYSFFLPPFSFQIRVGALYLLYSLHGCQTAAPRQQVANSMRPAGLSADTSAAFLCCAGPGGAEGLGAHQGF